MALRAALGDPHRFAQGLAWRLPDADRLTTQRMLACDHAGDILTALTSAFEQDAKDN